MFRTRKNVMKRRRNRIRSEIQRCRLSRRARKNQNLTLTARTTSAVFSPAAACAAEKNPLIHIHNPPTASAYYVIFRAGHRRCHEMMRSKAHCQKTQVKKNTYTWPTRLNWNILQHWCQAYHHTVLPPSEFYGTITDPLHVYSESCRPNRFYSAMLCIERTMLSQDVRPSVSHTPVFTAKHIVKLFSPPGNHAILVFFPSSRQYSDGDPLTGALNAKRCGKNRDIQPISRFISDMMLNKTMVTMEGE